MTTKYGFFVSLECRPTPRFFAYMGTHIREVFGEVLAVIKREYPSLQVPEDRHYRSRVFR